ncbi:CocE/NonD family hydrolase [Williamsia deligens]|uniref:CocE/NonD family hydrolase n=1 Tax=Williamsia deligens TaxID=321325 RepID=A0ABW3G5D6_9NOCA|nr:CocE/NonD family hydrolase [Williamsia deligens]MCP2193658.1 ABC-2 type transport system ATP-binding protein [Williamsia deligens]
MRTISGITALVVTLLTACLAAPAVAAPASGASAGYTTELLHFSVHTGPGRATPCTIVGQLYRPDGLSGSRRAPAILTTNGFGGSYKTQAPIAAYLATQGYVVLAYSGLGFGGSTCPITLDDPDVDGVAASQLVDYLGGRAGVAFTDAALRRPAPRLDIVTHDATDHTGRRRADDPRIGMIGGSYGGGIQFATAAVDPRIDTIVPQITWNDLSYSLAPNATSTSTGVSSRVSGSAKTIYAAGLFLDGVTDPGRAGYLADPARIGPCPNFTASQCATFAEGATTGEFGPASVAHLRHASVASYLGRIRIPVLLEQGQRDTLFDLNEATATYQALRARGVETKMIWHQWGHSGAPAPGEYDKAYPDRTTQYEVARSLDWFDHHLRGADVSTGPDFAYFRDWVPYSGIATPAYASGSYPVGAPTTFRMSAGRGLLDNALVPTGQSARPGSATIRTPPLGAPTQTGPFNDKPDAAKPVRQDPGTYARWDTAPRATPLDVVGIGSMRLRVRAVGQPLVFAKVYDVAPDGTADLINGLVSPVRITDPSTPVTVTLSGLVHRFAVGHRLRVEIAGGDQSFRNGLQGQPVTILSGGDATLTLPVTSD